MPATVTAPTVSGSEAVCPENRVKALDVLSWPRVGVRSPESPDRCWENRPRYDGKAVGTVVARYYDPTTAQFLTLDPDVATTLSPYGYVAGDPLNGGDPSGLCGWAPWDWLSCLVSNSIQSQNELAHPTWGQAAQNLLNAAAILNMEDGGGEAIEGCELATEGAAEKAGPIAIDENAAGHIFNDAPGHMPDDTATNRALLTDTANNPANRLGTDQYGSDWYARTREDGSQIWARVQSTGIRSGGVNPSPGTWDPLTGLYWP
jgi:RHS repeat-associated protein